LTQKAIAGKGESSGNNGGQVGIQLPAGNFSSTVQGSLAICLNPSTFAEESCSTSGVLVAPLTALATGAEIFDNEGNACGTYTEVDSNLPPNASPPFVTANEHVASKVLNYDSTSGTAMAPLPSTLEAHATV
jgi:hypothetical protein